MEETTNITLKEELGEYLGYVEVKNYWKNKVWGTQNIKKFIVDPDEEG